MGRTIRRDIGGIRVKWEELTFYHREAEKDGQSIVRATVTNLFIFIIVFLMNASWGEGNLRKSQKKTYMHSADREFHEEEDEVEEE